MKKRKREEDTEQGIVARCPKKSAVTQIHAYVTELGFLNEARSRRYGGHNDIVTETKEGKRERA